DGEAEPEVRRPVGAEPGPPAEPEGERCEQEPVPRLGVVPPVVGEQRERLGGEHEEGGRGEQHRCRAPPEAGGTDALEVQPDGGHGRPYQPPRRKSMTGTVLTMIFRSSQRLCRRMYSRS